MCFPRHFGLSVQTKWSSKAINEQMAVLVALGEPSLNEGHDAAVPEVLLPTNVSLKFVHLVPQGLDVPHDHRGQRDPGESLFPQA